MYLRAAQVEKCIHKTMHEKFVLDGPCSSTERVVDAKKSLCSQIDVMTT